jgi:hypothetical protein
VRWVEVAEAAAGVAAAPTGAADGGRDGWVALLPLDQVATVSAQAVANACRTWQACPATRKSAQNAAPR